MNSIHKFKYKVKKKRKDIINKLNDTVFFPNEFVQNYSSRYN